MNQQKSNGASATNGHSNGKPNGKAKRRRGRPPRVTASTLNATLAHGERLAERSAQSSGIAGRLGVSEQSVRDTVTALAGVEREMTDARLPRAELAAMERVIEALEPFDDDARARVLSWAVASLGLDVE